MCKVSDKIQFCSCSSKSYDKLVNYWVLHHYVGQKDVHVLGEIVCPTDLFQPNYELNKEIILKRLNEHDSFDTPMSFHSNDILAIAISRKSGDAMLQFNYTFEFSDGKWDDRNLEPFELENQFEEKHFGKIKSAFKNKSRSLP